MFVYFKWVLRRVLSPLLAVTAIAYTTMSSFGIAPEINRAPGNNSEQSTPVGDDSNPYSAIIKANVFHLTDPPKPAEKPDQALLSIPKVNISGFLRHADQPVRALFATVPKDPKESPRYFNLAEGEKEDILQVVKIHPGQDAVDVVIAGTSVTLTTKSNSFVQPLPPPSKAGVVPGGAAMPAAVAYHPSVPQPAPSNPYSGNVIVAGGGSIAPAGGSSVTTIGASSGNGMGAIVSGGGGGAGFPGASVATAQAVGGSPGLTSVPTRGQPLQNYPPVYVPRTANEAYALSAVGAAAHQPEVESGEIPPFPPLPQ